MNTLQDINLDAIFFQMMANNFINARSDPNQKPI